MRLSRIILALFFAFASVLVVPKLAAAQTVPTPVIRAISGGADNSYRYPKVEGWTAAGTEVLIYIDGTFDKLVQGRGSGSLLFTYQPDKPLPVGKHTIMAVARDRTSLVLSPPTKMIPFTTTAPQPAKVPAPTLLTPNPKTITGFPKPLVTGLTVSGTRVHIYIDGVHNGQTSFLTHPSGTANFAYRPFLNLAVGEHKVWAVAEDTQHRYSQPSAVLSFRIEPPLPAPILKPPVVNKQTTPDRPFIVGLAKNDSQIQIFIDEKLNGSFKVKNHPSGTANFAYRPFLPLTAGRHIAWAIAFDQRGKESRWSNIISFLVEKLPRPQTSAITESKTTAKPSVLAAEKEFTAKTKENKVKPEIKVSPLKKEQPAKKEATTSPNRGQETATAEEQSTSTRSAIDSLLAKLGINKGEKATNSQSAAGQTNRSKINLIIFLIFLFGVIAWIFWVNRELVKERQAQDQAEKKPESDNKGGS